MKKFDKFRFFLLLTVLGAQLYLAITSQIRVEKEKQLIHRMEGLSEILHGQIDMLHRWKKAHPKSYYGDIDPHKLSDL
jgi:hypothetical protein